MPNFTSEQIAATLEQARFHKQNGTLVNPSVFIEVIEHLQAREEAWSRWINRVGNGHDWLKALRCEFPDSAEAIQDALNRDDDKIEEDSRKNGGVWYA